MYNLIFVSFKMSARLKQVASMGLRRPTHGIWHEIAVLCGVNWPDDTGVPEIGRSESGLDPGVDIGGDHAGEDEEDDEEGGESGGEQGEG
jgi:hypothetical protein